MTITTQEELDIYAVGIEIARLEVARVERVMRKGINALDSMIGDVLTDLTDMLS